MTSENKTNKTWDSVKAEYLRQVEKALSSVKHPRSKEVVEDVGSHLDRRFAELEPQQQTWEDFQTIITEMGPASDYAELLNPDAASPGRGSGRRYLLWIAPAAVVIVIAAILIPRAAVLIRRTVSPKVKQADKVAAEELASKGWMLWNRRKLSEAEQVFKEAVSKDPANANAWNGLGWSQFNLGKPLAAKASFEKCVELQPEHAAALNGLGWIAKGQGKTDEAIGYWQKATDAAPNATAALNGLATAYMETGQYDKAVKIYENWLKVEPNNAQIKADLERAKSGRPVVELGDLPHLIAELSEPNAPLFEALNRIIELGTPAVPALIEEMKTSKNWQIPKALGAIADRRAIAPLIEKLETSSFSPMREVLAEALETITGEKFGTSKDNWQTWWEKSQQKTYIVTFKPVAPFAPETARELLDAFNKNHPRRVRTHHYRTRAQDDKLVGYICVDTQAGADAVVSMLEKAERLELIESKPATNEDLEKHYKTGQVSLRVETATEASVPIEKIWGCVKLLDKETQTSLANFEKYYQQQYHVETDYESASQSQKAAMVEQWIEEVQGRDYDQAVRAAAALCDVNAQNVPAVLAKVATAQKGSNRVKWIAVRGLAKMAKRETVPGLISLIDHHNANVRTYAKVALAEISGSFFGDSKEKWSKWAQEHGIEVKEINVGPKPSDANQTHRHPTRSPSSHNKTVSRTGTWPGGHNTRISTLRFRVHYSADE